MNNNMNINASICRTIHTSMYCAVLCCVFNTKTFTHSVSVSNSNAVSHFNMVWIATTYNIYAANVNVRVCLSLLLYRVAFMLLLDDLNESAVRMKLLLFSAVPEPIAFCAHYIKSSSMLFTPLLVLLTYTCVWEAHTKNSSECLSRCVCFCFSFSTFLRCIVERFTSTI